MSVDWKTVSTIIVLVLTILGSNFFSTNQISGDTNDQTDALLAAMTALQAQQEQQIARHQALVEYSLSQQKKINRLEVQQAAQTARDEILEKCRKNQGLCGLEGPET